MHCVLAHADSQPPQAKEHVAQRRLRIDRGDIRQRIGKRLTYPVNHGEGFITTKRNGIDLIQAQGETEQR
jgi:hypothetical protein